MGGLRHYLRWRWIIATVVFLPVLVLLLLPRPDLYEGKPTSRAIYDTHGKLLRLTLSPDEKYRLRVSIRDIAPVMQKATLLYEDRYFYKHYGVNPPALFEAAWTTYIERSAIVGASTITMQLAKLQSGLYTRSITGKLLQIFRALQLEWHYSKDEILEAYLNLAPYGGNIEGIDSASLIYFNKHADQLTLHEALTLAVIPQSPVYRGLDRGSDNRGLEQARDELIRRWYETYPDTPQAQALLRLPLQASGREDLPFHAPHFVESYLPRARAQDNVTTLDLKLQHIVERNLRQYVEQHRSRGIYNATALLVDYRDMSIRAMVGSADFFNEDIDGQVNGTLAKRSPGSTLKPFIYALALQQGIIHTQSMLKDAPAYFGAYNPENYDRDFIGPVSATDALINSRNIPAVALASRLSSPGLYEFLQQAGLELPYPEDHYGLSLVLGGAEVSMISLVNLYAMLANEGQLRSLRWDQNSTVLESRGLLSPQASYLALQMLGENPGPGTDYGTIQTQNAIPVYWKTGTSFGFRDAWSVGIFGPYVMAVWVGNFQGDGNPVLIGRKAAGPLFFRLVDAIRSQDRKTAYANLDTPGGVKQVEVCALSGEIANTFCPVRTQAGFIPGVSPIHKCRVHRQVHIDRHTGLRACKPDRDTLKKVYEFWPSDLLSVFREAGISRQLPPPFPPACPQQAYTTSGMKPEITSPLSSVSYIYRAGVDKDQPIALSATTDGDIKTLYWFVNESFIGKSDAGVALYWNSRPGEFMIRVIDDHGRSSQQKLVVDVSDK